LIRIQKVKATLLILSGITAAWLQAAPPIPAGMMLIPGGAYKPLLTQNAPVRSVPPFLLDIDCVTNGQFLEFVRAHPQWRRSQVKAIFADSGYLKHWASDLEPGTSAPLDAPVVNVSWFAARAYLKAQGKRLPTTDEWEFAARASATEPDASKDANFTAQILSWYSHPSPPVLPAVGGAEANVYGVRGLHGLVWEWVLDFNNAISTGESRDRNELDRLAFCGAGALGSADPGNYAAYMRFAFRSSLQGSYCIANLGFRGAKDSPTP
jgi:formylglycine-generating enzyme required for sulfatase activity